MKVNPHEDLLSLSESVLVLITCKTVQIPSAKFYKVKKPSFTECSMILIILLLSLISAAQMFLTMSESQCVCEWTHLFALNLVSLANKWSEVLREMLKLQIIPHYSSLFMSSSFVFFRGRVQAILFQTGRQRRQQYGMPGNWVQQTQCSIQPASIFSEIQYDKSCGDITKLGSVQPGGFSRRWCRRLWK